MEVLLKIVNKLTRSYSRTLASINWTANENMKVDKSS